MLLLLQLSLLVMFTTAEPFTNLHIFVNSTNVSGRSNGKILVITTLETLGDEWFSTLIISNKKRLIEHFATNASEIKVPLLWYRTTDLAKTLEYFNLQNQKKLPYNKCYYHISTALFIKAGHRTITASVSTLGLTPDTLKTTKATTIVSAQRVTCDPRFHLQNCDDFRKPLYYSVSDMLVLRAIYTKHCPNDEITQYTWTLLDSTETIFLSYLGGTMKPEFKLQPYKLRLVQQSPLNRMVLIRMSAGIVGRRTPLMARCYLALSSPPVMAAIHGGALFDVYNGRSFKMDGSFSVDMALPRGMSQELSYEWSCVPKLPEVKEKVCKNQSVRSFNVPAWSQPPSQNLTWHLTIRSLSDPLRTGTTRQILRYSNDSNLLIIIIECISNCIGDCYTDNKPIHLKASCDRCDTKKISQWKWTVNKKVIKHATGHRLIYKPKNTQAVLKFRLTVVAKHWSELRNKYYTFRGLTRLRLTHNFGPKGTNCVIMPKTNQAMSNTFEISCIPSKSKFVPFKYCVSIANLLIDQCTTDSRIAIHLPPTKYVTLKVCDVVESCTDMNLTVHATPLLKSDSDNDFSTAISKAKSYLAFADWQSSFLILYEAANIVKTKARLALFADTLASYTPDRAVQLVHLVRLVKVASGNLDAMDDMEASILGRLMRLIASTFELIISNNELSYLNQDYYNMIVDDLCDLQDFFNLEREYVPDSQCRSESQSCLNIDNFSNQAEALITFQPQVLLRVNNWLYAHWTLNRCLYYMSMGTAHRLRPQEGQIRIVRDTFSMVMEAFELDRNKSLVVYSDDQMHKIIFSRELMKELGKVLHTDEVLVSTRSNKENQYWWYPGLEAQTQVLVVNIYTATSLWDPGLELSQSFQFVSKLKRNFTADLDTQRRSFKGRRSPRTERAAAIDDPQQDVENYVEGKVHTPNEVRMYRTELYGHSLLSVTFKRLDIDYDVLLHMADKANHDEMDNPLWTGDICTVRSDNPNTSTILFRNRCQKSQPLFIYLHAADVTENWDKYEKKGACFEFFTEIRMCRIFKYTRPEPSWETDACLPDMTVGTDEGIRCNCNYITSFDAVTLPIVTVPLNLKCHVDQPVLMIDYQIIGFYMFILIAAFVYLYLQKHYAHQWDKQLYVEILNSSRRCPQGDVVVSLTFGGRYNAGTSSNLIFSFESARGQIDFLVYQNKHCKLFERNHTITFRLPRNLVALPARLALGHDNTGRYSRYFCRNVVVTDILTEETQIFRFQRWVRHSPTDGHYKTTDVLHRPKVTPKESYSWFQRFSHELEFHMANWYLFEPLRGTWRFGIGCTAIRRWQRSCIFICKTFVTLCIVATYYGKSVPVACDPNPKRYNDFSMTMWLCVLCFCASVIVQFLLERFLCLISRNE